MIKPIKCKCCPHIETSQLICTDGLNRTANGLKKENEDFILKLILSIQDRDY